MRKRETVGEIFGIALVLRVVGVTTKLCMRPEIKEMLSQGGQELVKKLTLDEPAVRRILS